MELSVIIPTLNEEANLGNVLNEVTKIADEVIIVDGFSHDRTVEIAKKFHKVKVFQVQGKLGVALRYGFEKAKGDIVIIMDADGSHRVNEVPRMVQVIKDGADVCMPSRFMPGGGSEDMPRIRIFGNWVFCTMVNVLYRAKYTDLNYGFRAFKKEIPQKLNLRSTGFEIITEISIHAAKQKLKVVEVPSFEDASKGGIGKLHSLRDGWRILKTIFKEIIS
jgi:glycosyltransferase involved in cell wall biosynthesis